MPTITTKFNIGDMVYVKESAEKDGKLVKGQIKEVLINQTIGREYPLIVRYRIDCGALVNRSNTWLEDQLLTEAEARAIARQVLHNKRVALELRENEM